jgi:phosphatidylserine/phosphatidylglycerophosphate/cardiolipin synthase-like enzyme
MRFEVVVRDVCSADDLSKQLLKNGCKSVATYICNRLHAKVYIFESLQHDLSLVIGSHNPTRAGMSTNLEVGVRVNAAPGTAQWRAIVDLRDRLKTESQHHESMNEMHRSQI